MRNIYNKSKMQPITRNGPSARGTPGREMKPEYNRLKKAALPVNCSPARSVKNNPVPDRIRRVPKLKIRAPEQNSRAPDETDVHLNRLPAGFGSNSIAVPQQNQQSAGGTGTSLKKEMNFNRPGEKLKPQPVKQQPKLFHWQLQPAPFMVTRIHRPLKIVQTPLKRAGNIFKIDEEMVEIVSHTKTKHARLTNSRQKISFAVGFSQQNRTALIESATKLSFAVGFSQWISNAPDEPGLQPQGTIMRLKPVVENATKPSAKPDGNKTKKIALIMNKAIGFSQRRSKIPAGMNKNTTGKHENATGRAIYLTGAYNYATGRHNTPQDA